MSERELTQEGELALTRGCMILLPETGAPVRGLGIRGRKAWVGAGKSRRAAGN